MFPRNVLLFSNKRLYRENLVLDDLLIQISQGTLCFKDKSTSLVNLDLSILNRVYEYYNNNQ